MNRFPILKHLLIAIAILAAATLLITFGLPKRITPPELLSPWLYGVAAVLALIGLFRIQPRKHIWVYIPILLMCIMGVLEETSYGVESGGVQPIYNETYNVQIYDIHNLIPILEQIFTKDLVNADWNFELSNQFLRADAAILFCALVFVFGAQWQASKANHAQRTLALSSWIAAFTTLAAAAWLLSLPADSKNALLFGFSAVRLAILAIILVVGPAPLAIWLNPTRRADLEKRISTAHSSKRNRVVIIILLVLAIIAGIAFQIWAPLAGEGELAIATRLSPLALWATGLALLILIAIHTWAGSLQNLLTNTRLFFVNNPAYVYFFFCLTTVVFAQAMDQDRISLAQYIHIPNPWGDEWNYWLEELFEMSGALQLIAATFFFSTKQNGKKA